MGNSQGSIKEKIVSLFKPEDQTELKDLFVDELKGIYWAEKKLIAALERMANAATSQQLKSAFIDHGKQTEVHVTRLEEIFRALGEDLDTKKCAAMAGLIADSEIIIDDTKKGTLVRDSGLIIAAQKVEHHEVASYGSLKTLATTLNLDTRVSDLLEITLAEEKETDVLLTQIAQSYINERASIE